MQHDLVLFESANNECKNGNFKEGIHLYSQYLKNNENDAKAFYQRGKAHFQLKNYNAAISDLNKAMKLEPNDAHLYGERGLVYFMASEQEKSMNDFNTAIELEPNNPYRWASRAFINDKIGNLNESVEDYKKALEIDPEDAISYNNLGIVLEKLGRKAKAEKLFEKAAEIDPKNFGMSDSMKERAAQQSEKAPVEQAKSEIKSEKTGSQESKIKLLKNTIGELISSKAERKDFWNFVRSSFRKK